MYINYKRRRALKAGALLEETRYGMQNYHVPIMLNKCIDYLRIKPDGIYFDGTLGGGGHSQAILQKLTSGRLIAVDRDSDSIIHAGERLSEYRDKLTIVHDNYENAGKILDNLGLRPDGAILDLGISSHQIDDGERGFSYIREGNLDMRMDRTQFLTAFNVINEYSEGELGRIIRDYGEDNYWRRIASFIVRARAQNAIRTTTQLAEIIKKAVPGSFKGGHPAKKTFQAVRIEVNGELAGLEKTVRELIKRLKTGGRLAVITFHSLEDRIVKDVLRELSTDCICDKKLPICVCRHKASVKLITKAEIADENELEENPRAQSAKLRVAEKIRE